MAKNTNTKIKELKSVKPEKITAEQLTKTQQLINNLNNLQMQIGQFESRKHQLLHQVAGLNDEMSLLQTEFEKIYGTNDINIQDGTINYQKENGEVNS